MTDKNKNTTLPQCVQTSVMVSASKIKVLNLYAGLGGNRQLWENCEVTALEMEQDIADVYKKQFPNDTVVVGDAHQYLLDHAHEFDFIWSSPPCQTHSRMMKATRHKKKRFTDMSLYQEIIFLQHFFKGKWIVENVKPFYEPLIKPNVILGRHYVWSNFEITDFEEPNIKGFITAGTVAETEKLKEWLGIQYDGNIYYKGNHCPGQVLRNCVHPKMGLHVFNCMNGIKEVVIENQMLLFTGS
jgi:DNA (cytosine-5)-methyltransferase 1